MQALAVVAPPAIQRRPMSHVHHHSDEQDPGAPYLVQLLFAAPPALDREQWKEALGRRLGADQTVETVEEGERLVVSLPKLLSKLPDGEVPVQVTLSEGPVFQPQLVGEALQQTWDWPEARERVSESTCAVVVSDLLAGGLARQDRLRLIHAMVGAVIQQAMPVALHWVPSQRIVEPAFYHESLHHGGGLADAVTNVRLYRIGDGVEGETVMDTLGLAPFGLPDLQIHFTGLDPGALAPVLLSYTEYLFDKGDVLDEDALVRGIEESHEWGVRRQRALAPPARDVVDIRPDDHAVDH